MNQTNPLMSCETQHKTDRNRSIQEKKQEENRKVNTRARARA